MNSIVWMAKPAYFVAEVSKQSGGGEFTTTHWSVVRQAGGSDSPQATQALETMCGTYWYPLYAHVRRNGHSDAQDLTQEFFARLLERKYLQLADPNEGRFRTFLLTSLKNFLINDSKKGSREKRYLVSVIRDGLANSGNVAGEML